MESNLKSGRRSPRLVLCSATFETRLFGDYFVSSRLPLFEANHPENAVPVIEVHQHSFGNTFFFLDDVLKWLESHQHILQPLSLWPPPLDVNVDAVLDLINKIGTQINSRKTGGDISIASQMYALVSHLSLCISAVHNRQHQNGLVTDGVIGNSVLLFMPGLVEIETLFDLMQSTLQLSSLREFTSVHILHGLLEDKQDDVLQPVPAGHTRIIIATNIAESSLTLPALRFVLDFGLHKQLLFNEFSSCDELRLQYISQASAKQRSGRCGRLCPGVVFRMYSRASFEMLDEFDSPEMQRVSMSSTILRLKSLQQGTSSQFDTDWSDPVEVLSQAMQPPSQKAIELAFNELEYVNALMVPTAAVTGETANSEEDEPRHRFVDWRLRLKASILSPIGALLSSLPFSSTLALLPLYASQFSPAMAAQALVITIAVSTTDPFVLPRAQYHQEAFGELIAKTTNSRRLFDSGSLSEPIALLRAVHSYLAYCWHVFACDMNPSMAQEWCFHHGIASSRMKHLCATIAEVALSYSNMFTSHPALKRDLEMLSYLADLPVRQSSMLNPVVAVSELGRLLSVEMPIKELRLKFVLLMSFRRTLLRGVAKAKVLDPLWTVRWHRETGHQELSENDLIDVVRFRATDSERDIDTIKHSDQFMRCHELLTNLKLGFNLDNRAVVAKSQPTNSPHAMPHVILGSHLLVSLSPTRPIQKSRPSRGRSRAQESQSQPEFDPASHMVMLSLPSAPVQSLTRCFDRRKFDLTNRGMPVMQLLDPVTVPQKLSWKLAFASAIFSLSPGDATSPVECRAFLSQSSMFGELGCFARPAPLLDRFESELSSIPGCTRLLPSTLRELVSNHPWQPERKSEVKEDSSKKKKRDDEVFTSLYAIASNVQKSQTGDFRADRVTLLPLGPLVRIICNFLTHSLFAAVDFIGASPAVNAWPARVALHREKFGTST